jgi:hypothetical protein
VFLLLLFSLMHDGDGRVAHPELLLVVGGFLAGVGSEKEEGRGLGICKRRRAEVLPWSDDGRKKVKVCCDAILCVVSRQVVCR